MLDDFVSLLPDHSTNWELAVEQTSGERWKDVDHDIIRRFKNPWECPEHLLNFLAHEMSVDIWDENWPILKKRSVIASSIRDHRMKGTLAGLRRYLQIADANLVQVVRLPQGFSVARNLTKEEQDAWVAKHPKVRLILSQGNGVYRRRRGIFVGRSAIGVDWLKVNEGRALYGRKAFLVKDGVSTPLNTSEVVTTEGGGAGTVYERFVIPGRANRGTIVGRSGVGRGHVGSAGKNPQVYTYGVDRAYSHRESALAVKTLPVSYEPLDVRVLRESDKGVLGKRLAIGRTSIGNAIGRNRAGFLLADVLYLHDPTVDVPRVKARSFVGYSRISMKAHQADILVDWKKKVDKRRHFIIGMSAIGDNPVHKNDTSRRDFLIDAITSSKRLSDKIRLSLQQTRERTLAIGAPLDGSVRLGQRAPNRL